VKNRPKLKRKNLQKKLKQNWNWKRKIFDT